MTDLLTPQDVSDAISIFTSRNNLWTNKNLYIFIIANKTAGCFTKKSKASKYKNLLKSKTDEIKNLPVLTKSINTKTFTTEYAGHGKELAEAVIAEVIAMNNEDAEYLIVTAGGDGTSLEVQTSLFKAAQTVEKKRDVIMNKIAILRLPLGTGNDGTDGHTLEETINLLCGKIHFENSKALKIYPTGNPSEEQLKATGRKIEDFCNLTVPAPWYAFNIASIGLDAYVCHNTNIMKKKIPGNFYQLCVPISGLMFYTAFPKGKITLEYLDENNQILETVDTTLELFAMGVSGHRTYGGGHLILPTDDNTCHVPRISVPTLISQNPKFIDGSFIKTDIAYVRSAEKVRINYDKTILLQVDGEIILLCKEHFPLIMEKTAPCLRVLKAN